MGRMPGRVEVHVVEDHKVLVGEHSAEVIGPPRQVAVPVHFYRNVGPHMKVLGNLGPAVGDTVHRSDESAFLVVAPGPLQVLVELHGTWSAAWKRGEEGRGDARA